MDHACCFNRDRHRSWLVVVLMATVDRIAYAFDRLRIMPRLLMLWYMALYSWWISVQVYNAEAGADEAGHNAMNKALLATLALLLAVAVPAASSEEAHLTWRGLTVADENRCRPYASSHYRHSAGLERKIVESMDGDIYSPYTGQHFADVGETDIEHVVAKAEAHDSGLCARGTREKTAFANDLLSVTLAAPRVNRRDKADRDAAEWLPPFNRCWYANRIVQVRKKHQLTIDRVEAQALDAVFAGCSPGRMIITPR